MTNPALAYSIGRRILWSIVCSSPDASRGIGLMPCLWELTSAVADPAENKPISLCEAEDALDLVWQWDDLGLLIPFARVVKSAGSNQPGCLDLVTTSGFHFGHTRVNPFIFTRRNLSTWKEILNNILSNVFFSRTTCSINCWKGLKVHLLLRPHQKFQNLWICKYGDASRRSGAPRHTHHCSVAGPIILHVVCDCLAINSAGWVGWQSPFFINVSFLRMLASVYWNFHIISHTDKHVRGSESTVLFCDTNILSDMWNGGKHNIATPLTLATEEDSLTLFCSLQQLPCCFCWTFLLTMPPLLCLYLSLNMCVCARYPDRNKMYECNRHLHFTGMLYICVKHRRGNI